MITVWKQGGYYQAGKAISAEDGTRAGFTPDTGRSKTMAYGILSAHNLSGDMNRLKIKFDAMASHDITYVGIIQTARASGLTEFPLPYVLTNCHNSLCAVGGTINEDDHVFGLSAAKKYGGEFVPAHMAVIHSYMRERYAGCGKMIIGSDSHTRYGAYGTMAIGEGGPELVKQLLGRTYDVDMPPVVGIYLTGKPRPGVGPQDVALSIIEKTFTAGTVKNAVMEFFGPGIASLAMDYRSGIDVMTTETSCLSSIWETDDVVKESLTIHGRSGDYRPLHPQEGAYYDTILEVDLSSIECMIALPFHPSCAVPIHTFNENLEDLLHEVEVRREQQLELKSKPESLLSKIKNGKFYADQGVIAGCSGGTYQNLKKAAEILNGTPLGSGEFWLSAYPASMPVMMELGKTGDLMKLMASGVSVRSAFCGPCFGAGDVPANGAFSIRHSTRNFPNREGSKPGDNQLSYVALMDARSIAASALNGGAITAASDLPELEADPCRVDYHYDDSAYKARVYYGVGKADPKEDLVFGPNIADWPQQIPMPENLLLTVCSAIYDPLTTTDELIPSGETSSYRSNPLRLSEFALSRKDPQYVSRAKAVHAQELQRQSAPKAYTGEMAGLDPETTGLGSVVMSIRPGDGSAREQAASCQRVLGGCANICLEYATKRYRSNVINWGMVPFTVEDIASLNIQPGDQLAIPGIRAALKGNDDTIAATLIQPAGTRKIALQMKNLSREERDVILSGCLINYYAGK